jgi:two-component system osmolarity sensor histidine kinase EnvZ
MSFQLWETSGYIPLTSLKQIEPIPDDPFLQLVIQKAIQKLPLGTLIAINHFSIEGIWVSFELNNELFWVVIPRTIVDRPFHGIG